VFNCFSPDLKRIFVLVGKFLLCFVATTLALGLTACDPASGGTKSPGTAPSELRKASDADLSKGKEVYTRVCGACHQTTGLGLPLLFPPLAGSAVVDGDTTRLLRIILHGLQGPYDANGKTFNAIMPPQAALLNDQEISDALNYVRSTWGHSAQKIAPADVAKVRAENRSTPWSWTELNSP
jgi:mono/diheme cytochrome c family protein